MSCDDERIHPHCVEGTGNQRAQQRETDEGREPEYDDGIALTCAEMAAELKGLLSGEIPLNFFISRQAASNKADDDEQYPSEQSHSFHGTDCVLK